MNAPISRWLRETRERQLRADGLPWSQDDLLSRMQAAIGWAPHRPNYSKYENGKATPKPETLARFVEFWAAQGEPGPDLTPPPEPVALDPYAIMLRHAEALEAIAEELRLAREERAGTKRRLDEVDEVLRTLVGPAMREPAGHDPQLHSVGSET